MGVRAGILGQVPSARNVIKRGGHLIICEMNQVGKQHTLKNGPDETLMRL